MQLTQDWINTQRCFIFFLDLNWSVSFFRALMSAVPFRNSSLCVSKASSISVWWEDGSFGESRALFCSIFIIPIKNDKTRAIITIWALYAAQSWQKTRACQRQTYRAATFCVLWHLMRNRNAAPLLWWLIKQKNITWTRPAAAASRSFCANVHTVLLVVLC